MLLAKNSEGRVDPVDFSVLCFSRRQAGPLPSSVVGRNSHNRQPWHHVHDFARDHNHGASGVHGFCSQVRTERRKAHALAADVDASVFPFESPASQGRSCSCPKA